MNPVLPRIVLAVLAHFGAIMLTVGAVVWLDKPLKRARVPQWPVTLLLLVAMIYGMVMLTNAAF